VVRVLPGRVVSVNLEDKSEMPQGDGCVELEESDLTDEQYAKFVSALLEVASENNVRDAKLLRVSGKDMEIQSSFVSEALLWKVSPTSPQS